MEDPIATVNVYISDGHMYVLRWKGGWPGNPLGLNFQLVRRSWVCVRRRAQRKRGTVKFTYADLEEVVQTTRRERLTKAQLLHRGTETVTGCWLPRCDLDR